MCKFGCMMECRLRLLCMLQPSGNSNHNQADNIGRNRAGDFSDQADSLATLEDVLIASARNGDVQAFGELLERHRSACLKRAMLIIRNRSDAEDEVQNAFWKAFQRLEQFRGDGSFGAWLSRITENQCLMRIREERNLRFVYLDEATESNVRMELVGQLADPEDELESMRWCPC